MCDLPPFTSKIFNEPPSVQSRTPLEERHETDAMVIFMDHDHQKLQPVWYAEVEEYFVPE